MLLFVGLGNPGQKYAHNRHNIGFMAIDQIAKGYGFSPFKKKFQGQFSETIIEGQKILLLKPETFMNESGKSVGEAVRLYRLRLENIIIFYDDLDLAPGKLRMKTGGGLAGHNGLRSLKQHMGENFRRARLGIGHPGHKDKVIGHVLKDFSKAEQKWLPVFLQALADNIALLIKGEAATYQNRIHEAMAEHMTSEKLIKTNDKDTK